MPGSPYILYPMTPALCTCCVLLINQHLESSCDLNSVPINVIAAIFVKKSLTEVGSLRAINQESCREYSIACCSQPDLKVGVEVHNFNG